MSAVLDGRGSVMESSSARADRRFAEFRSTGSPEALAEVYDLLAPELLRLALHLTRDAASAEDVLQAAFVVAIEEAARFDPARRVLPWLVGILGHEARKERERAARRPDPARLEPRAGEAPEDAAERAELLARLDRCLARIPAAYRPVLQLRLRHGLTVAEIAAALERSPGTVRSELARGTEHLRRLLPAGLAGGLVVLAAPARGLAAVRAAVVEHAALHGSLTAAGAATAIGVLAMKKLAALAAVLVAGVCLWRVARPPGTEVAEPASPVARVPESELGEAVVPPPVQPERGAEREAAPSEPRPAPESREPGAARGGELVVHARWPDGTPAADEIVLVTTADRRADEALSRTTDEQGVARFTALAPGYAQVRLLRGGESPARISGTRAVELTLSISAGVTVAGRVRDALGEPVAGAEIWLSERYRNNLGHVVARSDARGAFTLRELGPDHYVGARKPGFAPSTLHSLRGARGDRLALELELAASGGSVRGVVVDPDGRPIPLARVLLGAERPPSVRLADGSFAPAAPPQRAEADAEGRFAVESIALEVQPLQARARGFAPLLGSLEVLAGGVSECRIVLEREARLTGRVRDAAGMPVASAWVQAGEPELFASATAWSASDGRFVLEGLGREHALVRATHPERGSARRELRLAPGETAEWEAVLVPEPRIEGRIVDARGEPLAHLVVIALAGGDREQRTRSERSDSDGRFALSGLEDRAHDLWVQAPLGWREFPMAEAKDVWPGGPPLVLQVPDEREHGRVALAVTTADGTPLAGAELNVWHVERRIWRSFVSAGDQGAILASNVPPGTLDLELRHPEHPWKALGEQRIEAGATLDLGTIALEPSGRLRVHLRGLPGERHATLSASLIDATNRESGVARLSPGLLEAGPLAPGEHRLVLGGDGVRQVRRSFTVAEGAETELELALEPCPVREVAFVLPAGASKPAWIACTLLDASGAIAWGGNADCTRDPPVARVSAPAGTYRLRVGGEGGLAGDCELAVAAEAWPPGSLQLSLSRSP